MNMKPLFFLLLTLPLLLFLNGSSQSDEAEKIETLLHWFLESASDYDTHNRFWADELVYTGSGGDRIGKKEILSELRQDNDLSQDEAVYSGDQIQIQLYGDSTVAVVTFRLIADVPSDFALQPAERNLFYNTGTFIKQDGEWRAVAWQATRIPGSN